MYDTIAPMTANFERIKDEIQSLSIKETHELMRVILIHRAYLGLDTEINDMEAVLALFDFIKEKAKLLPLREKQTLVEHLRSRRAPQEQGHTTRCAHCWGPLQG